MVAHGSITALAISFVLVIRFAGGRLFVPFGLRLPGSIDAQNATPGANRFTRRLITFLLRPSSRAICTTHSMRSGPSGG